MEVMVAEAEASTGVEAVVASTAVPVFQVEAITAEVPASAAIAAVGMVTAAAAMEVRRRREGPDLEDLESEDLGSEDPGLEDLGLEDPGTLVASPPVIERRLLTGSGILLEETAVGLAAERALGVGLAGAVVLVDAALAGDAGAAGLASVLVTASAGILSGFGHRTGIACGGDTIIRFIPIRTSSGHFSAAGSGVLVERLRFSR
jgi:hypothetical protein